MQLIDYLKTASSQRLNEMANRHQVYYEPNFSKLWVADKLQEKLLNSTYLKKIINNQLSTEATQVLKQLINTTSINKSNLSPTAQQQLKKSGLIYEKNDFYYLPEDLKTILTDNLQANSTTTAKSSAAKQQTASSLDSNIKVKTKAPLSFYDYLLLSLSYLQQNSQQQLTDYLNQINFTSLSTKQLKQYLLNYAHQSDLLTEAGTVTSQLENWTQTDYKKILLQTLDLFFPQRQSTLRKIIAVLIHYPPGEQISIANLESELDSLALTKEDKQFLQLLNLFAFTDQNLSLTSFCWQTFNSQLEENLNSPQTKKQQTIVQLPTARANFWEVCTTHQLTEIDEQLIFKEPVSSQQQKKIFHKKI